MSAIPFSIRHIAFTGPNKAIASMDFGDGLNVVYGASDTGKSFVLEAIDFVLGAKDPMRDIPEREGYDRVFLGLKQADGGSFTLVRAANGGKISCYQGLHKEVPAGQVAVVLSSKHNPSNQKNLSMFLLSKMGLSQSKIRKNAQGATNTLSFRNLAHLCLVAEDDIQKKGSPIETGNPISKTPELSVFKLLLTGVDDSALQPEEIDPSERLSRSAKIEVIDELIANYRDRLTSLVGEESDEEDLQAQLGEIDQEMTRERSALDETEQAYRQLLSDRNDLRLKLQQAHERRSEVDELLARFALLDEHYASDLSRLEALREAGTLVLGLSQGACPLCGAPPHSQDTDSDCEGNVPTVIAATDAEAHKIIRLREELRETIGQLRAEAENFDSSAPMHASRLSALEQQLRELSPAITEHRSSYTALLERRATVKDALGYVSSIAQLEDRKSSFEAAPQTAPEVDVIDTGLSSATLERFSKCLETVLQAWHFPDSSRVYFDKVARDFVISGKARGARGKGMRAITHAAFTIALLEYTKANNLPHPGFVVLDTPLLAYREPEGDEDDLSGTDVKDRFYLHLSEATDRQIIVLENIDPPQVIASGPQSTFFSKNPNQGRYGLFPPATS